MNNRTWGRVLVYLVLLISMVWLKNTWNRGGPSVSGARHAGRIDSVSGVTKVAGQQPGSKSDSSPQANSTIVATTADFATVKLAEEILASKNDNDHRLDTEFNHLSAAARRLLEARYSQYPSESRNERGTLVLLLGRDPRAPEDFAFLRSVLTEPACLSLSNCARDDAGSTSSESLHLEAGAGVTLAYPQLVALKQAENFIFGSNADPSLLADAIADLEAARRSPVSRVAQLAEQIYQRYQRQNGK